MKKITALLLAALMLLTVMAGCKKETGTNTPTDNGTTAPTENTEVVGPVFEQGSGSFYLTADASVLVSYDVEGVVQKVEAQNYEAEDWLGSCSSDPVGADCAEVVSNFIGDIKTLNMGEMPYVIIKQNKGSGSPSKDFMAELKTVATEKLKNIGSSATLVVLSADKMDSNNHLDLASAKTLATAFLYARNVENFSGDAAPIDGFYSFYICYDGKEEEVHVNALTGGVGQGAIERDEVTDEETSTTAPTQPSAPAQG